MKRAKPIVRPRDGNVFAVIAAASAALRQAGLGEQVAEYQARAQAAGSYDKALQITMEYVDLRPSLEPEA